MNKQEIITSVAAETNTTLAQTEKTIDAFLGLIKGYVHEGHEVKLVGFGTFLKNKRQARIVRNPRSGELIKIPAAWFPKFRAGQNFKDRLK